MCLSDLTHIDEAGRARMVDISEKQSTTRVARAEGKLANEGFVSKAPPAVVEKERKKLEELKRELADL